MVSSSVIIIIIVHHVYPCIYLYFLIKKIIITLIVNIKHDFNMYIMRVRKKNACVYGMWKVNKWYYITKNNIINTP